MTHVDFTSITFQSGGYKVRVYQLGQQKRRVRVTSLDGEVIEDRGLRPKEREMIKGVRCAAQILSEVCDES